MIVRIDDPFRIAKLNPVCHSLLTISDFQNCHATTTVPFMYGWMLQWYGYVPVVLN